MFALLDIRTFGNGPKKTREGKLTGILRKYIMNTKGEEHKKGKEVRRTG